MVGGNAIDVVALSHWLAGGRESDTRHNKERKVGQNRVKERKISWRGNNILWNDGVGGGNAITSRYL